MKKRVIAPMLIVSVLVLTASLTGCTSASTEEQVTIGEHTSVEEQETTGDSVKLTVSWWGNQVRNERTNTVLNMYSEENPGITFDGQFSEYSDYWNKLATASAGHNLPDIVQMDYAYFGQYVENGLLLDLTPYINDGTLRLDDADQNILLSGQIDGKTYGICNGINAPSLFYNKTALDEAGITVKDGMTWNEFAEISKEVKDKTGYSTNVGYNNDTLLDYCLRANDLLLYEDGKLGVQSPEELEVVFKIQQQGIEEGWSIDPSVFTEISVNSAEQDPLVYGNNPERMSWCSFATSNQLSVMQNAAPDGIEIGITTWPTDDIQKSNYLRPSQFFAVSIDCENPIEAVKVIDWITNSVECNEILLGERGIPISLAVSEAILSKMDESSQKVVTYINDVVTPCCSPINPPSPLGANEVLALKNNLEEQVLHGKITASEAAQQLFEQGNAFMQNAQK